MELSEVAAIRNIISTNPGINLFFALKEEESIKIKRADLADGDTQKYLKEQFISVLAEDFDREDELHILDISGADERAGAFYRYDFKEFPKSLQYFYEFDYKKKYEFFSFKADDLLNLDAYLVVIGTAENYCVIYKKFYPVFLIGRDSFFLFPVEHRFAKFDKEILRISKDYQFIRINGKVYIKDLSVLEKFGGFRGIIEKEAQEAIDAIGELDILEELDGLKETMHERTSFARKLCKLKNTSQVLKCKIPGEEIVNFSKTHPGIAGNLKYNKEGNKILLTTKKSQNLFLKLLDDSYLTSLLTRQNYDSMAKEWVPEIKKV